MYCRVRFDVVVPPSQPLRQSVPVVLCSPGRMENSSLYLLCLISAWYWLMDFWASLEHDIRYKVDKTKLPEGINEEMFECAGKIAEIDRQMQDMYQRIKASDAYNED